MAHTRRNYLVDDDEPATPQMMEFASRTHQNGTPRMARDYRPASQDQAAMPVRVERWRLADGTRLHRIVGFLRGTDATEISTNRLDTGFYDRVVDVNVI